LGSGQGRYFSPPDLAVDFISWLVYLFGSGYAGLGFIAFLRPIFLVLAALRPEPLNQEPLRYIAAAVELHREVAPEVPGRERQ
jgi:hypothetical protein